MLELIIHTPDYSVTLLVKDYVYRTMELDMMPKGYLSILSFIQMYSNE